jgi:uncharacterized protein (TIGR02145 family)
MKKTFTLLLAVILTAGLWAQAPQKLNYQAIIRNTENNLIVNQAIGMRISILHGSEDGNAVYTQVLNPTTNANGLVTIEIGGENELGAIDWPDGPYFLKTETDPEGNANYTITGTSQILTVPYALHAISAETLSDPGSIVITESQITDLKEYVLSEDFDFTDAQPGDVLQFDGEKWAKSTLAMDLPEGTEPGEMLFWDGSAWVAIPPGDSGLTLTLCDGIPVWGPCPGLPIVTITGITNITQANATVTGNVVSDGGFAITERGICYSEDPNPTIEDNVVSGGSGTGLFTAQITGLTAQVTYYVRAYATNSEGTSYSQQSSFTAVEIEYGSVTDADGNEYRTVTIGNQEWMAQNLKTTKYRDGTDIPLVANYEQWEALTTGAYSVYNDNYGALYNWFAVNDKEICPAGWSVPSDAQWTQLTEYIINNFAFGGESVGRSLKSCRQVNSPQGGDCQTTVHPRWNANNTHHGTDNFGFAGLPGGNRGTTGNYSGLGAYGFFWTSSQADADAAWGRGLNEANSSLSRNQHNKKLGFSIRCIKN